LKINGKNPAMLYGYGGFNISLTPSFSVATIMYLEKGGIYAVANIRGGGEYGEEWHQSGTKLKKQNVFDDFIAAAEYLIESGYSNPDQLTIRGGSNGGLLVGAVTNQRPDLFKVALPAVGVLDMLRYQKFTIGYAWATDYGTVDESEEMFKYLLNYSPYHNVKAQDYPAILATTADHDDRVVPAHTFKYISRVQELNTGKLPTLVRIDVKAGHGSGKPTTKIIEEFTDIFSFVFYHTGIKW
jgi:prolyl oligopeptidase